MKTKMTQLIERLKPYALKAWQWTRQHPALALTVAGIILVLYMTILVSTIRVRHSVADYLVEATGGDLHYKKIKVSPTLKIVLEEVSLKARNSALDLPDMTAKRVLARADLISMLGGRMKIIEVSLDQPVVSIYKGPDGSYNLSRWINRLGVCENKNAGAAVPNRVYLREGRIMMEPPPGASWFRAIEIARIDGYFGRTPENNVGVRFRADAFQSSINISGGFVPCVPNDFKFDGVSDDFNFSEFRDFIAKLFEKSIPTDHIPGGTGHLQFSVEGSYDAPVINGQVSLRDFDATFSAAQQTLRLTDIRAGIGTEKITGEGMLDFSKQLIPFKFDVSLKNIKLERLLRKSFGFRTVPEGSLSGHVKMRGQLKDFRVRCDSGDISITDGILKIPSFARTAGDAAELNPILIPFTSITAQLSGSDNRLNFINLKFESDALKADGAASISGINGEEILADGAPYSLRLNINAEDAGAVAELFPSLHDRVGGALTGNVDFEGSFRRSAGFSGRGLLELRKGFISNPYSASSGDGSENIDVDFADAKFNLGPDSMRIISATMSGNGLYIETKGDITYEGSLNLTGNAQLASEWVSKFYGLSSSAQYGGLDETAAYDATFTIGGTVQNPLQYWRRSGTTTQPQEDQPSEE